MDVYGGAAGSASSESDTELRISKRSSAAHFSEWLGHWMPEYDAMDQNELMLQVLASPAAAVPVVNLAPHMSIPQNRST